ncbi:hypothetical protein DFP72DRAFT_420320 [Ephemerocybe angulata]|uniref:Uncharacterized protein n=1 Tax=Ephemerocybe angulata TaxID=980116 RepID=A0A8H6IF61_9AGAR|nr:hypothetical protein DFP72DRAFT_420320 [Tulosesus angulatus]
MSTEVPVTTEATVPSQDATIKVSDDETFEAIPDESEIIWKEATSANGNTFFVGTLKSENLDSSSIPSDSDSPIANATTTALVADSFSKKEQSKTEVTVNWPVGDSKWKQPGQEVFDKCFISKYCLTQPAWPRIVYDYILYINANKTRLYYFTDETGDTYQLEVVLNQTNHYVKYNSKKPTIVKVGVLVE